MGSLSSWFVFSSTGFYPVTPASNVYVLTSPVFDQITIQVGQGKTFTVQAKNNSKENVYIHSVILNGKPINRTWISHQEVINGGTLIFELGPEPNRKWGSSPEDTPSPTI
jgi:putative alpha-1,2-mannosidase